MREAVLAACARNPVITRTTAANLPGAHGALKDPVMRTALPDALAEGRRKAASALDEGGHAD